MAERLRLRCSQTATSKTRDLQARGDAIHGAIAFHPTIAPTTLLEQCRSL